MSSYRMAQHSEREPPSGIAAMATEKQKVMTNSAEDESFTRLTVESDCESLDILGPSVQFLVALQANDEASCVLKGTVPGGFSVPIDRHQAVESF
jgi:hypothetical protein